MDYINSANLFPQYEQIDKQKVVEIDLVIILSWYYMKMVSLQIWTNKFSVTLCIISLIHHASADCSAGEYHMGNRSKNVWVIFTFW